MKPISEIIGQDILSSTALFDSIKDPVFLMEQEHDSYRYLYANASALSILPTHEVIGSRIDEILPQEQSLKLNHYYQKVQSTQKPLEFIEKISTDNREFIGETILNPILTEDHQCLYILAIVRDVTAREQKKKELQNTKQEVEIQRERLNSLVENNGNAFFEFDQQMNFISINKKVTEVTGFSKDELLGQSIVSLVADIYLEETLSCFKEALNGNANEFHTAIYTKNNKLSYFQVNTIPIIVEERLIGIYAIAKEITEQKEISRLLKESQQRYKSLFDNHPHGIFSFDRNGNLESGNTGAENITGYSMEELLVKSFMAMVAEQDIEKMKYYFYKAIKEKQPQRYEFSIYHKAGQLIDLEAMNIPIIVNEHLVGIHGIVTDVTEKKRAQKELTETKENLEIFWENSTDPIFYIDTNGDILKVNPAFEATFGFTEAEMIEGKGTIIPQHMRTDQLKIVEQIVNGETVNSHDTIRITKSGKHLNIISSYSPVRNVNKEVTGATIIYKNVTNLKEAERELMKSQEKYKLITESTFDIITLINLSGQIEYVSPANEKILGYSDQAYIGSPFTTNAHPEDAFKLIEGVTSLIDGGRHSTIEVRFLHRDGHYIWMEVSPTPVMANGKLKQFFMIARDITERKRLQDKIAKMAFYDYLSGIPNRRTFDDRLQKAIQQAERSDKKVAVLMLDGRKFKQINDQFGHDAGDAVIKEMATRLQASIRPHDTAARLGGDEMGVVLPDITSVEFAEETAIRILTSFQQPFNFNGSDIKMGAGIGISIYPDHATDEKYLIKYADLALYEAKKSDHDEFKVYS